MPTIQLVAHTHISGIIYTIWCSAHDPAGDDSPSQWFWYLYFSDHNLNSLSSLKYLFNLHIYSSQIANAVVAYIHANDYVAFICLLYLTLSIAYVNMLIKMYYIGSLLTCLTSTNLIIEFIT